MYYAITMQRQKSGDAIVNSLHTAAGCIFNGRLLDLIVAVETLPTVTVPWFASPNRRLIEMYNRSPIILWLNLKAYNGIGNVKKTQHADRCKEFNAD